ncbi:MAG: TIGR00282 family metallophosphoesterase [Ignavibacteria bacterium]|nr:TIGR00282 family metallophosphoesterase [Ignavibacteria bacterium]MBK6419750.1 TIGR00282 family metallophosphoesterase [Ignavibacteria bacterium]MBK6759619.1 TIGR00282 family metallophosphoesterase [Ignavibacteria bacterium]MBK7033197.1 TIGR00282 family metallophosphoesterase [Ignavibacteria bacterium]MBK7184511.1 TIGR00282 family metallophosphoesterase [Ignavibacteria bacterium]
MRVFNLLFIGDVVGHVGLRELLRQLPSLKEHYKPDCLVVNGENIVDGKGLSDKEAAELFDAGVHCITTGNHIWENWKARPLLASNQNVLRPMNYPIENPGRGFTVITLPDQRTVGIMQAQGRVYMQAIDCPFKAVDAAINKLAPRTKIILLDFHADATAEKIAMGWHCDGRVSAVLGTHTHVQTGDARILPQGTAYLTDTGMTGPYDSVLGMKKDIAIKRLILQTAHKYEVAEHDVRVCGVHLQIDEDTGKALSIEPFMLPRPLTNTLTKS